MTTRDTTSTSPCFAGGIANATKGNDGVMTATTANQLCIYGITTPSCFTPLVALTAPEGIAVDGDGNVWIATTGRGRKATSNADYAD